VPIGGWCVCVFFCLGGGGGGGGGGEGQINWIRIALLYLNAMMADKLFKKTNAFFG